MEGKEHETLCVGGDLVSWEDWRSFFVLLGVWFAFLFCIPIFFMFVLYSSYDWSRLLLCNRRFVMTFLALVDDCLNNYRGMFLVLAK